MANLNPRYYIFEENSTLKKTQYLSQLITDVTIRNFTTIVLSSNYIIEIYQLYISQCNINLF